jgi:Uma2 family endonuclease
MSTTAPVQIRRWKRVEYDRLIECGIFRDDERIELIDGLLLVKEPQSSPHAAGIRCVFAALQTAFGADWHIDMQLPIALDDDSEPEPDVSVLRRTPDRYASGHPSAPVLVVEVALTRPAFNRRRKGGLYARARVPEYWILNLVDRILEVRRTPRRSKNARYGWQYSDAVVLGFEDSVVPLVAPTATIRVADLLPQRPS